MLFGSSSCHSNFIFYSYSIAQLAWDKSKLSDDKESGSEESKEPQSVDWNVDWNALTKNPIDAPIFVPTF